MLLAIVEKILNDLIGRLVRRKATGKRPKGGPINAELTQRLGSKCGEEVLSNVAVSRESLFGCHRSPTPGFEQRNRQERKLSLHQHPGSQTCRINIAYGKPAIDCSTLGIVYHE
jgi:hypothetical protein